MRSREGECDDVCVGPSSVSLPVLKTWMRVPRLHVERHIAEAHAHAIIPVTVQSLTMNELVSTYWDDGLIDLLMIDAEGHEATILHSIDFSKFRPQAIFFESHNLGASGAMLSTFLGNQGYDLQILGGDTAATLRTR